MEGLKPDSRTLSSMLIVLCEKPEIEGIEKILRMFKQMNIPMNEQVYTMGINAYGKVGRLQ
jgi:hypothetical protein